MVEVKHSTIRCKACNRKVRDTFDGKWKHAVRMHPEWIAQKILPMIWNPQEAFRFGEALGVYVRSKII